MQKVGILNSSIAKVLADLGHTDTIVIGDCGLPVPAGVPKIDLALKLGTPSFMEVVSEVAKYMEIEKVEVAAEIQEKNTGVYEVLKELFPQQEWIIDENHEAFKAATAKAKVVIRTGEITPYANIILHSNVIF
jgi:D-ribose pyranase